MPLTKLRRPKFERQDIKQNLFSNFLSCQRLNKIQKIIKAKNLDALLIILGIDSKFNSGSLELFNYLFFDIFITRKDDIVRSKLDDDVIDDVMICVKIEEVHVYCNGANYWLLLPYMAFWQGLRLHCISEIEMEDPEKLEKFKMNAFVEMTTGCDKIAVVTKSTHDSEPFDPMYVENWPIIQSFAYDDFGRNSQGKTDRGFFTLVHKVVDVSSEAHKICQQVDPVQLEDIYQKILPQMEGVLENIFQMLDSRCCGTENFEIDEQLIEEPVISYYKHVKNNRFHKSDENFEMYPFVLCGQNTRQSLLSEKMKTFSESWNVNREKVVKQPKHLIVKVVSLTTGLVIARTLFLQGCSNLFKPNSETENINADVKKLLIAYNAIITTTDSVITNIKNSTNITLVEKNAEDQMKDLLVKLYYSNYTFRIKTIGKKEDSHGFIVIIEGAVFDIRNESRDKNLGSVVFAETFVITSVPLSKEDNINAVLRLGKKVPLFNYWTNNLEPLGSEMVDIIYSDYYFQETPIEQMFCSFYSDRVLFFNKRSGCNVLFPDCIDIFEGGSYGDWTILSMCFSPDSSNTFSCTWNRNTKPTLHLIFPNHSKLKKYMNNFIIPKWKEFVKVNHNDNIKFPSLDISWKFIQNWMTSGQLFETENSSHSIIDGISESAHQSQMIKVYNTMNFSLVHRKSFIRIFCQLMTLSYSLRFYNNITTMEDLYQSHKEIFESFEQSWCSHSIINPKKLALIKKTTSKPDCLLSINVTIICGLPGSDQDVLATKITRIIHDDCNWILLKPKSIKEVRSLTENQLISFDNATNVETKSSRILLLSPPMCFPNEIVKTLQESIMRASIIISSVCVCVNPESAYFDNKEYSLPGVLEMCNEGWVDTILLTGPNTNSLKTVTLQRILKARNDLCTIFLTPKADVTKELDAILSKVAFQQERFTLSRILLPLPDDQNVSELCDMRKISNCFYEISYILYGALIKENIIKTIRDILRSGSSTAYAYNIYFIDGVIRLEEDLQHIFSFTFVSSTKQLIISPLKNKEIHNRISPADYDKEFYLKIFVTTDKIVNLNDNEQVSKLKNYFLSILKNFQRQAPEKRNKIQISDLTSAQIDEIHNNRHLEKLPEGWFYNGSSYVHMDGRRSDKHPALPEFINDFIQLKNSDIEKSNIKIHSVTVKDVFMKP